MILQALTAYYNTLVQENKFLVPGWGISKVGYLICLRKDGSIREIVTCKDKVERKNKTVLVPRELRVPEPIVRSSGISANFLCDTAAYLLGYTPGDKKAVAKFEAARALHLSLLVNVPTSAAQTLCAFFETHVPENVEKLDLPSAVLEDLVKSNLTFTDEDGGYLMDDEEIQAAWDKAYHHVDEEVAMGRCLVTGNVEEIAVIHNKIKGIPGAQAAGATLVGFNAPAFSSYGKDGAQGWNAPIGRSAMTAYTTALNALLSGEHRSRIGDTTVVWWTADDDEELEGLWETLMDGDTDDTEDADATIAEILKKLRSGEYIDFTSKLNKEFYILGLSPNAARLSVRFFYHNTFGHFLENVAAHYDRLSIDRSALYKNSKYPSQRQLLMETVSSNLKWEKRESAISPPLTTALYSAVLNNWRYPEMLYEQTLIRIQNEQNVSPNKAAILKAYLLQNGNFTDGKEVLTMSLNEESTNQAYVLGRLFAALENAQYHAMNAFKLKDKNGQKIDDEMSKKATIKERYLPSACDTPGLVFPNLLSMSVHHIEKTKNANMGAGIQDEKLIRELLDKLPGDKGFPVRLNNTDKGLFLLGYYHQTQKKFQNNANAKAVKEEENNHA